MTAKQFWTLVDKTTDCWEWTGHVMVCDGRGRPSGYGYRYIEGRMWLVHRYSWTLTHGRIPAGLCVMHKCDNRICVRPDHLKLGTRAENNADRDAKGRHVALRGAANGFAKLTETDVLDIRARYAEGVTSLAELGLDYGVSAASVHRIVKRKAWAHV